MSTTAAATPQEEVRIIRLDKIKASATNPRKVNPKDPALLELVNSVKTEGVKFPILARPKNGHFEIIAGERRWTAAGLAGATSIPVIVREMSDDEAQKVQVIENLQRQDLAPLEEAAGFKRLLGKNGTVEQVASKLGKSPQYVALRLKLLELVSSAKDSLADGDITLGHALELCRLRPSEQEVALKWLIDERRTVENKGSWQNIGAVAKSVRELKVWIACNIMLDLSKAPFDTTDVKLNPSMGACTDCQYNTGNTGALFAEIKEGSRCLVPACFAVKKNRTIDIKVEQLAVDRGVKKLLKVGVGNAHWNDDKKIADVYVDDYSSNALLVAKGDECNATKPGVVTFIADRKDSNLKFMEEVNVCVDKRTCPKHSRSHDYGSARPKPSQEHRLDTRVKNLRASQPQLVRNAIFKALVAAAMKSDGLGKSSILQFCADEAHERLYGDRHRDAGKILELKPTKKQYGGTDWEGAIAKYFTGKPGAHLVAVTAASDLQQPYGGNKTDDHLFGLAKQYKVDIKKVSKLAIAAVTVKIDAVKASAKRAADKRAKASKTTEKQAAKASTKAAGTKPHTKPSRKGKRSI